MREALGTRVSSHSPGNQRSAAQVPLTRSCPRQTGLAAGMARTSRGLRLEFVAEAGGRQEVLRVRRVGFDLGAQPLDVDVQRLGVAYVVGAPHAVDQLPA